MNVFEYEQTYRDIHVIPDKHNTGCKGDLVSMADYFGDFYTPGSLLYIKPKLQTALGTVYENVLFDQPITLDVADIESVIFRNCRFESNSSYAIMTGNKYKTNNISLLCENCEFCNQTSAAVQPNQNIRLVNCKIYNMGGDGGKVFTNGSYENCYIHSIGFADGAHADGIQVTSENDNFKILNCRFDIPSFKGYYSNAAIFFILEGDSHNSVVKDCVMNGGNYTFYYGFKYTDRGIVLDTNTVENIKIGCAKHFGNINTNTENINISEITDMDKLFVSSVWREGTKTKLLVTNYTNEQKTLRVVTNNETKVVTIPACPTYIDGLEYESIEDFPFDIEVETDICNWIVCFDGEATAANQIRFVNFSEEYYGVTTISDLMKNICDSIRLLDGSADDIKHLDIPSRIINLVGVFHAILLDSIVATKTKVNYTVNDELSLNDIVVEAIYSNGATLNVTTDCVITNNIDTSVAGEYAINIQYTDSIGLTRNTTIPIQVSEETVNTGGGDSGSNDENYVTPQQDYEYYGIFVGKDKDAPTRDVYLYVTSNIQWSVIQSAGTYKLKGTGSGAFKVYKSYDNEHWILETATTSSTISLGLTTASEYVYDGTLLNE